MARGEFIEESEYLEHSGRKGMRWGQHIFSNERKATAYGKNLAAKTVSAKYNMRDTKRKLDRASSKNKTKKVAKLNSLLKQQTSEFLRNKKEFYSYGKAFSKNYGSFEYEKFKQKTLGEVGALKGALSVPYSSSGLVPLAYAASRGRQEAKRSGNYNTMFD